MKKELVKLANHLDNIGHGDLADKLDEILKSAQSLDGVGDFVGDQQAVQEAAEEGDDKDYADDEAYAGVSDEPPDVPPHEGVVSASSAQERINKMADLIGREFSTYVPGTFSR